MAPSTSTSTSNSNSNSDFIKKPKNKDQDENIPKEEPLKIIFIHPDLGIGGAERLVVDAAVGLQKRGHTVTLFTSHCDPGHCFDEARDGTLDVRVRGNTLIPAYILGRFAILCAILRQLHLFFQIYFSNELSSLQPDIFFVDQLSACVPLLRYLQPHARVLFYCHFPDQLLASRKGVIQKLYRLPFDSLEEWTTGAADGLVVNSKFTRRVFEKTFPRLRDRHPGVVYPCVDIRVDTENEDGLKINGNGQENTWTGKKVLLSINRFERKKSVELAVRAYAGIDISVRKNSRLVIAGGYDPRIHENVSYHLSLVQLAESLGLRIATTKTIVTALIVPKEVDVLFLLSVPASLKSMLLRTAKLLIYTPPDEHFGIVPLEAMLHGVPVLAANSGGPLESIVEGQTGWLRDVRDQEKWSEVMRWALDGRHEEIFQAMGGNGPKRVREEFSQEKMAERLEGEMRRIRKSSRKGVVGYRELLVLGVGMAMVGLILAWVMSEASRRGMLRDGWGVLGR
ncbi:MAG: hypothetical protein M1823_002064 [Watsoniomyces obsoletus]|nr:MAG: hypothetical protein M1823_002064 [Watsoniomyces obsoletus]